MSLVSGELKQDSVLGKKVPVIFPGQRVLREIRVSVLCLVSVYLEFVNSSCFPVQGFAVIQKSIWLYLKYVICLPSEFESHSKRTGLKLGKSKH